jgi:hypothetical protein
MQKEHRKNCMTTVEFEVLTTVTMKSTVFWDVTPFSPVEFY